MDTYSALVHSDYPSKEEPDPQSMPDMIWASNYYRALNHTLWTLFFAGKTFAPNCVIDDVNIQDWLQDHFTNAVGVLAERIDKAGDLYDECILGWDSINEPGEGLIGVHDISVVPKEQSVVLGPVPTPFESMKLTMGQAVTVPYYTFSSMGPKKTGTVTLDPKGKILWLSEEADKERGGGKWGWKRGDSWKLGTCSELGTVGFLNPQSGPNTACGTRRPTPFLTRVTLVLCRRIPPTRSILCTTFGASTGCRMRRQYAHGTPRRSIS